MSPVSATISNLGEEIIVILFNFNFVLILVCIKNVWILFLILLIYIKFLFVIVIDNVDDYLLYIRMRFDIVHHKLLCFLVLYQSPLAISVKLWNTIFVYSMLGKFTLVVIAVDKVIVLLERLDSHESNGYVMHSALVFPTFEKDLSSFLVIDTMLSFYMSFHVEYLLGPVITEEAPWVELCFHSNLYLMIKEFLTYAWSPRSYSLECLAMFLKETIL